MSDKFHLIFIVTSILFALGIFELVRSQQVREKYVIIWIITGFGLLLMAIKQDFIIYLAKLMGVHEPVNAITYLSILLLVLVSIEYSVILSRHHRHTRNLLKKVSLLQMRVEELEKKP